MFVVVGEGVFSGGMGWVEMVFLWVGRFVNSGQTRVYLVAVRNDHGLNPWADQN